MFKIEKESILWAGRELTIETGRIARQADGAALVSYGGTTVLATAVAERTERVGLGFMPLTVNYQEKYFAAGKIPGGYFKREGRPTEKETLVSRLIDRPIRPLFAPGFACETQVIATVLAYDGENDPDVVAMVAASAALALSGVPFRGPIGCARVGFIDGEFVINPTQVQMEGSRLDLVVAGTAEAVMMVESEVDQLSEAQMLAAVNAGHDSFRQVIEAINSLAQRAGKPAREHNVPDNSAMEERVERTYGERLAAAYQVADKNERHVQVDAVRAAAKEELGKEGDDELAQSISAAFKAVEKSIVRRSIIETSKRIDGRTLEAVRPIESQVAVLPRTHGSALFTRGETQALVVTTLGTGEDEQFVDSLSGTYKQRFMLHYNFPPYSVGEVGRMMGAGRREIGHGKLAWRALTSVMPAHEDFSYTIRIVSEITESNGSSSMATVCGSSLALMDAGVPLSAPVAGIAMGLILEDDGFAVLSDILGDEDHLGDMDFKVAGTQQGITALQMDIKVAGITTEIMEQALAQAHEGRLHILGEMGNALTKPRSEVGEFAPRVETIKIAVSKIRDIIGTGGKVIREMSETTGTKIDVSDDGTVRVAGGDYGSISAALKRINEIVSEPEVGQIYEGKVVKIMDFGAFVNFFGPRDGLVHISQLAQRRVQKVTDVVQEGDIVKVKLLGVDDRGKARLSIRAVLDDA